MSPALIVPLAVMRRLSKTARRLLSRQMTREHAANELTAAERTASNRALDATIASLKTHDEP